MNNFLFISAKCVIWALTLVFTFWTCAFGTVIRVPSIYPNIQAGIDAANNGDTVLVADGVYAGEGNINLDLKGKNIQVIAPNGPQFCVIDCERKGRGFYFHNGEKETCIISGFKIVNGFVNGIGAEGMGGGIYCVNSSPTIKNCVISDNEAYEPGGGIALENSSAIIKNCIIRNNEAHRGGGIDCYNSQGVQVINCVVSKNTGWNIDGGISIYNSFINLVNCTVVFNTGNFGDGGIGGSFSTVNIKNCIVRYNTPDNLAFSPFAPVSVSYSDIQGGWLGMGNIDVDPLFVDSFNDDYHLRHGSPCVDAGTSDGAPVTDLDGNPRFDDPETEPNTGAGDLDYIDMGAYEYIPACHGDFNKDSDVDGTDLASFAEKYGKYECDSTSNCEDDLNHDGRVDEQDLEIFAKNFGRSICPNYSN